MTKPPSQQQRDVMEAYIKGYEAGQSDFADDLAALLLRTRSSEDLMSRDDAHDMVNEAVAGEDW